DRQRPREVIIEEDAKQVRPYKCAFEMMPIVIGHEELAAVTRVVIAMRTPFKLFDPRHPVYTSSRIELAYLRIVCTREVKRCGDRHELASIDRTDPFLLLDERFNFQTRVRRHDADRNQRRARLRTLAWFILEYAFFAFARTDIRQRREIGRASCRER